MELSLFRLLIQCEFSPENMCTLLLNKLYSFRCRTQNGKELFRTKSLHFSDCYVEICESSCLCSDAHEHVLQDVSYEVSQY